MTIKKWVFGALVLFVGLGALGYAKNDVVVTVMGSDTPAVVNDTITFTVTVSGAPQTNSLVPTGTVSISVDPTGAGTLSTTTATLDASGRCTFTYTPTDGSVSEHVITVTYSGDANYNPGTGSFTQKVIKRKVDLVININPVVAYIYESVTITVEVWDDTTAGTPSTPTGTVTFDDGGKNGVFSSDAESLTDGTCSVTYTPGPGDAGYTMISVSYTDPGGTFASTQGDVTLEVQLLPTEIRVEGPTEPLLVYEPGDFTVHVRPVMEIGPAPQGTLAVTSSLGTGQINDLSDPPSTSDSTTTWTFTYICTGLDADGGYDTLDIVFDANDGVHAGAEIGFAQAVIRRPTETTLSCTATETGVSCSVSVADSPDNSGKGTPPDPQGDFIVMVDEDGDGVMEEKDVGDAPSASFTIASDLPLVNVSVEFRPTDQVYQRSIASENVDRTSYLPQPEPGGGDTGASCTDGCGSGGTNVDQILLTLNATVTALQALSIAYDAAQIAIAPQPEPIVGAGCGVITGTTIPTKGIQESIVQGLKVAVDSYILSVTTDNDGDGIPDTVELGIRTDPYSSDSDGDGMGDADEISYAGGYIGGSRRPNPKEPDSDGDGLLDGYELAPYGTNVCVADSDCDTVPDGAEIACKLGTGVDGFVSGFSYGGYIFPFTDPRDWPNPNEGDTDGDGLPDNIEFGPGRLAMSVSDSDYSPYVNDPDSDGDGILDGLESTDGDATWDGTLGSTGTTASGETHLCLADTDGDGLLDGEEESLFGRGPVEVHSPLGTVTVPANDDDSDDDGLSDYEEQTVTYTDPLNYDTDGDGIWDVNELVAIGGAWPHRQFQQISDPLDPDTDDDGLPDNIEYNGTGLGTGHGLGGSDDTSCPYVNDSDSDDDGLQDGYEDTNHDGTITNSIGDTGSQGSGETSFCNADTDGDGLTDGEEEGLFGQGAVTAIAPSGSVTTVPALDKDSDDDGLSDYEEVNVTHTDPLNWDTDGDGLSDLNELIATGGTYPKRSFQQVSDPLDPDTDDDGLRDNIEYTGTGLGTSHGLGGSEDLTCPYVNDADSDDDGLQDGVEDANHDGTWGVNGSGCTIGSFDSQAAPASDGYYETDPCNPDTDGDGLLDGEEVAQLGGGPTSGRPAGWPNAQPAPGFNTVTPEGRSTVLPVADYSGMGPLYSFTPEPGDPIDPTIPALDVDSDNDGLSDYEEVNITGTDPLDADSDNDTIMDADELIATGGSWPARTFDQESDPLDINTDDDHLPDPVEGSCSDPVYTGTGLSSLAGGLGGNRDTDCPYVNNADSDDDGVQDGAVIPITKQGPNGFIYSYVFIEGFHDVAAADVQAPGTVRTVVTPATGEQDDDSICNVCDPDSDGDGLTDGEEVGLGTNPADWDTDDDGRNDWHEVTGGGPIPTDPFDPDTDDDGLLDSAEVFGSNPTNPTNADTDGDGLCDGGAGTPYMTSGHPTVTVNPICKSCSTPGNTPCATMARAGSADGIGDHPNPMGLGEDENGNGAWDTGETDPNQYDTDGDAEGDGIEKLGFSTSRQNMIPATDLFGRPITVEYPACGCMDPLNPDTDGDGLSDGYEDRNHDGNFDFLPSEFDHADPLPGPPIPYPTETNPCDPDTDHDGLTDYQERYQPNPAAAYPFNPTNPLDHDTDNDYILDGPEVNYVCTVLTFDNLDNDGDGLIDEDPPDELDNDEDGYVDEDGPDFYVRSVPVLDPTNRDSDSDGFIDGLDPDPCNSPLIPIVTAPGNIPVDTDEDGYADQDEVLAGTDPLDPDSHPCGYTADLDLDGVEDDRLWLVTTGQDCFAELVVIDLESNGLVDFRLRVLPRDVVKDDFDGDGVAADTQYRVAFALAGRRVVQPRILLTIYDYGCDLVVDRVEVRKD